ncbi:MAG TPA: hypothetical protein VN522_05665 [Solirubrobacterales bacterium]|nr:hypothetical protein [Solirubrobacterales bacterium]
MIRPWARLVTFIALLVGAAAEAAPSPSAGSKAPLADVVGEADAAMFETKRAKKAKAA